MKNRNYYILSTRPLNAALIGEAAQQNIIIEELSFIHTENIKTADVVTKLKTWAQQSIIAVFTSMNAVDAIAEQLNSHLNWKIYCIGNTTRQLVEEKFGDQTIAGTAANADMLADIVINNKEKEIVFFCGNQRRDELPKKLSSNKISVEEVVVYKTIETPHVVSKPYDGILFFSPSAVHSFFSVNKFLNAPPQFFAIGTTTAQAIQQYTPENVIVSETPGKEALVKEMLTYFSTQKV